MNTITHKTRLEIIRNNNVVNVAESNGAKNTNDCNISTNSSINSFPTLSIQSTNSEINSIFMDFSKFDTVRFSYSSDSTNQYVYLFEGEFCKKTIKYERESNLTTLDIEAIHSFFRLSLLELTSMHEFIEITFQEFVSKLTALAEINSKITISKELAKEKVTGFSKNTNAFRLFKEVCLIVDAAVTFKTDNTVEIDYRENRLAKIKSSEVKNISKTDIFSAVSKDSI